MSSEDEEKTLSELIAMARKNSGLSDEEAMVIAVEETRALRRERAIRRRRS